MQVNKRYRREDYPKLAAIISKSSCIANVLIGSHYMTRAVELELPARTERTVIALGSIEPWDGDEQLPKFVNQVEEDEPFFLVSDWLPVNDARDVSRQVLLHSRDAKLLARISQTIEIDRCESILLRASLAERTDRKSYPEYAQ